MALSHLNLTLSLFFDSYNSTITVTANYNPPLFPPPLPAASTATATTAGAGASATASATNTASAGVQGQGQRQGGPTVLSLDISFEGLGHMGLEANKLTASLVHYTTMAMT